MKLLKLLFTGLFFILGLANVVADCLPIPSGASTTRCGPGNATVSVGAIANCSPAPYSGSVSFNWYTASTGGTLVTTTYVTSSYTGYNFTQYSTQYTKYVSATTSYWVSVVTGGVASSRVQVTFNVNEQVTLSNLPQEYNSRCGPGPMTVMVGGGSNATFSWYTDAGATTAFATTSIPQWNNPNLTETTTYYVSGSNGVCPPSARLAVTAKMNPELPPPATVPNKYVFGTVPVTFSASDNPYGSTVQWFASAAGGTVLANGSSYTVPNPNPGNSVTYYAGSTTGANCVSIKRKAVTATSYPIPEITPVGTPVLYSSNCPVQLIASSDYKRYEWKDSKGKVVGTGKTLTVYSPDTYSLTVYVGSPEVSYKATPFKVTGQYNSSGPAVNYVVSKQVNVAGVKDLCTLNNLDVENVQASTTFFDGLGRPIQQVDQKASPLKKDLVQPMKYDEAGRQPRQYLPYAAATGDGNFKSDWSSAQLAFYNNNANNNSDRVVNDANPFSVAVFDDSPLQIVKKMMPEGEAWQNISNNHSVSISYRTNSANEVRNWTYDHFQKRANGSQFYEQGQLRVQKIKDEDGNPTWEYKDNKGQVVLKKQQDLDGNNLYLETYYVYDDFGNLRFVIPPQASVQLPPNYLIDYFSDFTDKWLFTYKYDSRRRIIEKKTPGVKAIYYVYDKKDRLALSQDGNQRSKKHWDFIKYDVHNRILETGIYIHSVELTQSGMQDLFNSTNGLNINEKRKSETTGNGYSNTVWPTADLNVHTVNYYDDYDFDNNGTGDYSYQFQSLNGETTPSKFLQGRQTGRKTLIMDETNSWLWKVMFYDKFNRLIQVQKNNHKKLSASSLADIQTRIYDFGNNVVFIRRIHTIGASPIKIDNRYVYDHNNRLRVTYQKNNGDPEIILSQINYNEIGQPIEKNLHSENSGANFLQSLDYTYNIRGWLTHLNNSSLTNDVVTNNDADDLFGFQLGYETSHAGSKPKFNGSITSQCWKTYNSSRIIQTPETAYRYFYNGTDALRAAEMGTLNGDAWTFNENFKEDSLLYDLNGNIKKLFRSGTNGVQLDRLTYKYDGNKLIYVSDSANALSGFKDGINTAIEYLYDDNGNMTLDKNKGIDEIVYNYLNLIVKVRIGNLGDRIEYTYTGDGVKLQKKVYSDGGKLKATWDYVGPFVYLDNSLAFISTAEGRLIPSGITYTFQYDIKDHLGNVRVTFDKDPASGKGRIVQESHYYAFGMQVGSSDYSFRLGPGNKYLFNSKEFQDENGANFYDYGARMYDPVLCRWHTPDPLAAITPHWTPYRYAYNNPVNYTDLFGFAEGEVVERFSIFKRALNWVKGNGDANTRNKSLVQYGVKNGKDNSSDANQANQNNDRASQKQEATENLLASIGLPDYIETEKVAEDEYKVLGIHSNVSAEAGSLEGHSWISISDDEGNLENTLGLWPDDHPRMRELDPDPNGVHSDVRLDMEKRFKYHELKTNRSFYVRIGSYQQDKLLKFVGQKDTWRLTHTCADWARDAFKATTGIELDADDWFGAETPRELSKSIDLMPVTSPINPHILK